MSSKCAARAATRGRNGGSTHHLAVAILVCAIEEEAVGSSAHPGHLCRHLGECLPVELAPSVRSDPFGEENASVSSQEVALLHTSSCSVMISQKEQSPFPHLATACLFGAISRTGSRWPRRVASEVDARGACAHGHISHATAGAKGQLMTMITRWGSRPRQLCLVVQPGEKGGVLCLGFRASERC